jgi:hypothetical protein
MFSHKFGVPNLPNFIYGTQQQNGGSGGQKAPPRRNKAPAPAAAAPQQPLEEGQDEDIGDSLEGECFNQVRGVVCSLECWFRQAVHGLPEAKPRCDQ